MGRVRRYKKYKSADLIAKHSRERDTLHDEPPDLFEERKQRNKRSRDREDEEEDDRNERILQQEAMRDIRNAERRTGHQDRSIEGKRDGESQKQFKERIREETRKTLAEEITKLTSTARKRKERLKERTQKRKLKRQQHKDGEEKEEFREQTTFFSAADGRLRPSDLGESRSSFEPAYKHHMSGGKTPSFGEVYSRPPDLDLFTKKFAVTRENSSSSSNQQRERSTEIEEEEEEEEEETHEHEDESSD